MKKTTLLILILIVASQRLLAQSYRYIDVTDGLSNQNVYSIEKDRKGYMWMLTMSGVDRYDGRNFRNYSPSPSFREPGLLFMLHRLHVDADGQVWIVSMREGIMRYSSGSDSFVDVAALPRRRNRPLTEISYSFIDSRNRMWMATDEGILMWNIPTEQLTTVETDIGRRALCMAETGVDRYAVATADGVHLCDMTDGRLHTYRYMAYGDGISMSRVSAMMACAGGSKLLIGTDRHGLLCMDADKAGTAQRLIDNVGVSVVRKLTERELLVATDRAGVYRLDVETLTPRTFLAADYDSPNDIDSNNIRDIYVDDEGRIWLATNPYGVTVLTNGLPQYAWMRHSANTPQSISNNNVNSVAEDSDGDLWFATNDGVSMLDVTHQRWHSMLRRTDGARTEPEPFLCVAEVQPGVVWATGYSDVVYAIDKRTMQARPLQMHCSAGSPSTDRYINAICRDSDGLVWMGGCYTLRSVDPKSGECCHYGLGQVNCIAEADSASMWIGAATGLYRLEKYGGRLHKVRLSGARNTYIYALHQSADGLLYVGTALSGLLTYDRRHGTCRRYYSANSTLITDNIHSIVANADDSKLVLGTDKGLTQLDVRHGLFRNWTYDQGLLTTYFNPSSGVFTADGHFVMGSNDGAVSFRINSWHDKPMHSRMVMSDLMMDYEPVRPGEGSPLEADIDDTRSLTLEYDQNRFSISLSSINYDYPSDVVYSWRLKGFSNEWTRPGSDNVIRYSNLPPGRYTLQVRAISNESRSHVLEQRELAVTIRPPFWHSLPAIALYVLLIIAALYLLSRLTKMLRQRRISAEKMNMLVQLAHEVRTPLTLIKLPLEEVERTETLSAAATDSVQTALRGVDRLLHVTDNLIDYAKEAKTMATEEDVRSCLQTVSVAEDEELCSDKAAGSRLLIVEEDEELRGYLKQSLAESYHVKACKNGKQALTLIDEYKPDLIVSGIMMSELRGDELCRRVKSNIETSHIPVILLSALADEDDVLRGLKLKADAYMVKPFSMELLKAKIESILENRHLLWRKYADATADTDMQPDADVRLTEIDRRFLEEARRYVAQHIDSQELSVDMLCRLLHMSRTSFYNKLKALTGCSPADFIRSERLSRAAELLKDGSRSVTEVAEMAGFNDAKYFREVFKKHFGMPPAQYGKRHK